MIAPLHPEFSLKNKYVCVLILASFFAIEAGQAVEIQEGKDLSA